jgi:hypothetical protein
VLDGDRIVVRGRMERPNDGHIADTGRFALTDWHFGSQRASTFTVTEPDGSIRLQRHYPVNAGSSCLSPDGRVAALALLSNPAEPDLSNQLIMFDVDRDAELWRVRLPIAWRTMRIDPDRAALVLMQPDQAELSLRVSDGFVASEELRAVRLSSSPFGVVDVVTEELRDQTTPGPETLDQWDRELLQATEGLVDRPRWLAKVARLRGEIAEHRGDQQAALTLYQQALELEPASGVRRRIEALSGVKPPPRPPSSATSEDDRPYASRACPSCSLELDPLPRAKKKCPKCGEAIYVRGGPDGQRHLLRGDQLTDHDAWWEKARIEAEAAHEKQRREQEAADRASGMLVGEYSPAVVGESHRQETIKRIAEELSDDQSRGAIAELVPQPDNPHDRNAVAVMINGDLIGYLAREEAAEYSRPLQTRRRSQPSTCRVFITGGRAGRSSYGVVIDGIPYPEEIE